jgi:DNA-binding GntR family transcriptional regulator
VTGRGLPLYRQAADDILAMIASGRLGREFTVPEAAKQAGVKDWAARKAAEHLTERGLIEPHQGSGYRALITPEEASAARMDERSVRDQLAGLQREVAELRRQVTAMDGRSDLAAQVGRIEANLIALYGQLGREYPRGGSRERAKAAAGGGRR